MERNPESQSFTVSLPRHNQQWEFNRETFTTTFPESIITQALADITATSIDLVHSVVTPMVMDHLQLCLQYRGLIPVQDQKWADVAAYLNIDVLSIMSNPKCSQFPTVELYPLLYPEKLAEGRFHSGMNFAISVDFPDLIRYLLHRRQPPYSEEAKTWFEQCKVKSDLFRVLLNHFTELTPEQLETITELIPTHRESKSGTMPYYEGLQCFRLMMPRLTKEYRVSLLPPAIKECEFARLTAILCPKYDNVSSDDMLTETVKNNDLATTMFLLRNGGSGEIVKILALHMVTVSVDLVCAVKPELLEEDIEYLLEEANINMREDIRKILLVNE